MSFARKINIVTIVGISAIGLAAVFTALGALNHVKRNELKTLESMLMKERMQQLRDLVANAYSVLETARFYTTARQAMNAMRFGEGGKNCFILLDVDGMIYTYPEKPELVEKVQIDLKDAKGRPYIREIIDMARKDGQGFLEFHDLDKKSGRVSLKLAHFRFFESWRWIVCTAIDIDDIRERILQKEAEIEETFRVQMMRLIGLTVIIALVLAGLISFATRWFITRPIQRVVWMLKDIAEGEGDLTRRIDSDSSDETGELARWFNLFIEKIHHILKAIETHSGELSRSSATLLEISGQMAGGAGETTAQANQVTRSMTEMSARLNGMAASMTQATLNSRNISASSQQLTGTIGEIAQKTDHTRGISEEAVRQTDAAIERIAELNAIAMQIEGFNDAIGDISAQTNLLALNATIEAARAGEAGRGFAVVAKEIKELAAQTAKASTLIRSQIKEIQKSTENTIAEVRAIGDIIHRVNENVGAISDAALNQSEATRAIAVNIRESSIGMEQVKLDVDWNSSSVDEIVRRITNVNRTAEYVSGGSVRLEDNARELTHMAAKLHEIVLRFKLIEESAAMEDGMNAIGRNQAVANPLGKELRPQWESIKSKTLIVPDEYQRLSN